MNGLCGGVAKIASRYFCDFVFVLSRCVYLEFFLLVAELCFHSLFHALFQEVSQLVPYGQPWTRLACDPWDPGVVCDGQRPRGNDSASHLDDLKDDSESVHLSMNYYFK